MGFNTTNWRNRITGSAGNADCAEAGFGYEQERALRLRVTDLSGGFLGLLRRSRVPQQFQTGSTGFPVRREAWSKSIRGHVSRLRAKQNYPAACFMVSIGASPARLSEAISARLRRVYFCCGCAGA